MHALRTWRSLFHFGSDTLHVKDQVACTAHEQFPTLAANLAKVIVLVDELQCVHGSDRVIIRRRRSRRHRQSSSCCCASSLFRRLSFRGRFFAFHNYYNGCFRSSILWRSPSFPFHRDRHFHHRSCYYYRWLWLLLCSLFGL